MEDLCLDAGAEQAQRTRVKYDNFPGRVSAETSGECEGNFQLLQPQTFDVYFALSGQNCDRQKGWAGPKPGLGRVLGSSKGFVPKLLLCSLKCLFDM